MDEAPIAQGPYSSIHKCELSEIRQSFVMKQLRRGYMKKMDREAYLNSMREIDIHKSLKHNSIIRLYEVIDDAEDDKVYLIMEAAE